MRKSLNLALLCGAMAFTAMPAQAGAGCGPNDVCSPDVLVSTSPHYHDDMLVSIDQPMGHLRGVNFRRSPHVSVTRIHAMPPTAALDDAPGGFTGGCHPESTTYCRAGGGVVAPAPVPVAPIAAPLPAPAPVFAPVAAAPVVATPLPTPQPALRQWTASFNDDPSRFIPRQYGSLDFVPGIAHVPSSWVDRDPNRAQAALNASGAGGIAPGPQIGLVRIPDNTPGPIIPPGQFEGPAPVQPGSIVQAGPASHAPEVHVVTRGFAGGAPAVPVMANVAPAPVGVAAPVQIAPQIVPAAPAVGPVAAMGPVGAVAGVAPSGTVVPNLSPVGYPSQPGAPVLTQSGHYASQVAADGTYWEKVSGPTMMGDTVATQVICKRRLETEVVNPVVGVPTPVPYCGPEPHAAHPAHAPAPAPVVPSRYTDGLAGGQWTY